MVIAQLHLCIAWLVRCMCLLPPKPGAWQGLGDLGGQSIHLQTGNLPLSFRIVLSGQGGIWKLLCIEYDRWVTQETPGNRLFPGISNKNWSRNLFLTCTFDNWTAWRISNIHIDLLRSIGRLTYALYWLLTSSKWERNGQMGKSNCTWRQVCWFLF